MGQTHRPGLNGKQETAPDSAGTNPDFVRPAYGMGSTLESRSYPVRPAPTQESPSTPLPQDNPVTPPVPRESTTTLRTAEASPVRRPGINPARPPRQHNGPLRSPNAGAAPAEQACKPGKPGPATTGKTEAPPRQSGDQP